jgi:F0F1-type ATP synthase assembly protein I
MMWVSRITGFGLEVALLAMGGNLLDRWWGSSPWMTLVGTTVGFGVGLFQLIRVAQTAPKS